MSPLPFQEAVVAQLTAADGLVVLARGLGLRAVVSRLLRDSFTDTSSILVLLNASADEDRFFGEELGVVFSSISHEHPTVERQRTYAKGGIISVTSRILIVDILNEKIPLNKVSGFVVLRAESVSPTSTEAFILRVFRERNKAAFIRAFSDQPEHFTYGLSPLQTCLTQLHVRNVYLWPRFHADVQNSLSDRKADVVELHQPLSPSMDQIQTALIECLDATVGEIKRHNVTEGGEEDINVENALFRSFDVVLQARFDPVYHKISPKTRQLIADVAELRRLLYYLLTLDCVSFHQYLETILASNSPKTHKSPWLFMDAAETIFAVARQRVFVHAGSSNKPATSAETSHAEQSNDNREIDEEEEALLEAMAQEEVEEQQDNMVNKPPKKRFNWLPKGLEPVLEEQPKWCLLSEIMDEIEQDIFHSAFDTSSMTMNDTILIMCGSQSTCSSIKNYLSSDIIYEQDGKTIKEGRGARLLRARLKSYFGWKRALGLMNKSISNAQNKDEATAGKNPHGFKSNTLSADSMPKHPVNAALKRKEEYNRGRAPMNKRRRVRGGAGNVNVGHRKDARGGGPDVLLLENEAKELAERSHNENESSGDAEIDGDIIDVIDRVEDVNFDDSFGVCESSDLVVVRPHLSDEDDRVLEELQPRYIVMMDPDPAFIRRVECFRNSRPGQSVRLYFCMYSDSAEEQLYLSGIRREKESFERLIRENAVMAIPIEAERREGDEDEAELLRTVSTRVGGGGKLARADPPKVIVDMREFRSSLPALLHSARFVVIPLTLIIGDYILSPTMCVERKSVSDLVQSFNSGRLYQQCELMTVHYKQPILLIEFDQKKKFTFDAYGETKSSSGTSAAASDTDVTAKLVLLTLSFPRLRIIWSTSPAATADIFADLKQNQDEPDTQRASIVGAEEGLGTKNKETSTKAQQAMMPFEGTFNQVSQEILRSLPGVSTKNYRYLMRRAQSLEELTNLSLEEIQEIIGNEAGRHLHGFIHRDVRDAEG